MSRPSEDGMLWKGRHLVGRSVGGRHPPRCRSQMSYKLHEGAKKGKKEKGHHSFSHLARHESRLPGTI